MPRYSMTGRNGKLYTIDGPAGLTREAVEAEILKRAPEAAVPPQEENALEKMGPLGNAAAWAADIPLNVASGLAGVGKTFTDVFGANNAASQVLGDIAQGASDWRSSESRTNELISAAEQERAAKEGTWEQIKAAGSSFMRSPLDVTAQVAGSAIPFLAAGLAAPETGGASLAPIAAMAGLGAASGAGTIKGSIYDATLKKAKEAGVSDEQAAAIADQAQSYGGENLDQIALGTAIGAAASATGLPRQISSAIGKRAAAEVIENVAAREVGEQAGRRSLIAGGIKGAIEEAVPEAIQGGQERYSQNLALQRQGYDIDPMQGVIGQGAFEGIASIALGGLGGVRETSAKNRAGVQEAISKTFTELPADATPEQQVDAIQRFTRWGINEDTAKTIVGRLMSTKQALAAQEQQAQEEQPAPEGAPETGAPPIEEEQFFTSAPPAEQRAAPVEAANVPSVEAQVGQQAAPVEAANLPSVEPQIGQQVEPATAPKTTAPSITPAQAAQILDSDVAIANFADQLGIDTEEALDRLNQASVTGIKYSRGRPPATTADNGLFGNLPTQEANRLDKAEELTQLKLNTTPEQRIAQQEEVLGATAEQIAQRAKADEENRVETLGDIEYALRAQAPENAVYKVDYDPTDTKAPYKLLAETKLGKKPEVVFTAPTLQDFSDQVYGQMGELTPFIAPSEVSAQTVEAPDTAEPTVATDMIRQFTGEVDTLHQAGQIDNNQRSELLSRLERPNAYRTLPNGQVKPNDAIARAEAEANRVMEEFRAAENDQQREEASAKLGEINQRLTAAVQNGLLNPLRARMKTMVETRADERLGAAQRVGNAKVQEALGKMEGADVAPEQRELREAKIDERETKVQKYRRGVGKGMSPGVIDRIVSGIVAGWKSNVPVTVVSNTDELPAGLRAAVEQDGAFDAKGLVDADGNVYLIADNLTSEEDARAVLFHEGLGHIGLAKLFRDKLDNVLKSLYTGNKNVREATDAWMKANPDSYAGDDRIARAVEEVLAERSETGVIPQSIMQRLIAVVRDFARKLGFDLDLTDGDVNAILAAAHDMVVKGDGTSTALKGVRYILGRKTPKAQRPKTTAQTKEELLKATGDISDGLRRTMDSQDVYGMAQGIGDAIRGHSDKPFIAGLKENFEALKPSVFSATLYSLPTSGILDWFGKDIYALREVDKLLNNMINMKANIIAAGDDIAKRIEEFVNIHGSKVLAGAQSVARINEYSPDEFASMEEALKDHGVIKLVEDRILKNTNDKKRARQLMDALKALTVEGKSRESVPGKGELTRFTKEANAIIDELETLAIDSTQVLDAAKQLSEMARRISQVHLMWDQLAKQKGGQQLYKDMREFYKDMFEAELALLDERIAQVGDEEQATRLRDVRAQLMRETLNPDEAKKSGDIFWNVPADLFQKDYFPFMREGKYWLYVKGKPNVRERQFYTFNTAKELNRAKMGVARKLGVDPNDSNEIAVGNNIDTLQEEFRTEDALMQKVFDIVDKAKKDADVYKSVDFNDIRDAIYQTWLMTSPERSVRRRLMHADEVTGYSSDVLNHFSRQVTAYANQLSKMAYAGRIRNEVKGAYENIKDRPNEEARKLETVVREIEKRTEQEINPDPQSAIVNFANRMSFFYYLTSAATAMTQLTSIPIRVVPRLWGQYGYAKGTAAWLKYMKVWKSLGIAKTSKVKTGIGDELHAMMPSVLGSDFLTKGPRAALMQRAAKAATERNLLQTVSDTLVQNERETAKKQRKGVMRTASNVVGETAKVMGVMFNGMENISRQASFFMAFELAYDDYKAKNPEASEDEAFNHAMEQGTSMIRDTLGDYSSWERPRLAKNNWTRALFLFKMYSVVQTKFFIQNFNAIVRGTGGDRVGAMKELTGVLMMAGMFGGLTGMPLYSLMAYALAQGFDDEDDEDVKKLMQLDPRVAYDSDIMFRKWIMENFGNPKEGDTLLADMLIHGPISTLTNTDIGSRTSLDLKNMWFREAATGDSTSASLTNFAVSNIAGAQMAMNMAKGYDSFSNGDIEGGLKKILPAFFRSWVSSAQMANEGVQDTKGNVIIAKKDISDLDAARALLGFRPMDLARWQDYYITRAKNEQEIERKKQRILDRMEQAIRDGDIATQADLNQFVQEEVVPFNRTYPDPKLAITDDTIERSIRGRNTSRAQTVKGMQVSKKTAQRDLEMAAPFMPK